MLPFNELDLSDPVLQALNNMGFEETTPIQEQAIPVAMEGKDLIGQALTGTGKTAAFGIPMVERFSTDVEQIQGIVITPTRELAVQVAEELNRIGQFKGIVCPAHLRRPGYRAPDQGPTQAAADHRGHARPPDGPYATPYHTPAGDQGGGSG